MEHLRTRPLNLGVGFEKLFYVWKLSARSFWLQRSCNLDFLMTRCCALALLQIVLLGRLAHAASKNLTAEAGSFFF